MEYLVLALMAAGGMLMWTVPTARAQSTTAGSIIGQVTDAQGAAIVGATVLLENTATNGAQPTVTNSVGRFAYPVLQPGTYSLSIQKDGFKKAVVNNQVVQLGKPLTINVPMQVGTATQTVEVTATGADLQTMSATVGTTISSKAILELPALGRDANSLTMLQPNTEPDGSVAGATMDQNTYTLDGGSNSDDMDGSHNIYTPASGSISTGTGGNPSGVIPTPAETIETFTVGVNNQSADINSAAGSTVTMATRRGTNTLHGSAYEYYLGSALGANSWSNNANGRPRSVNHQNRFGATLGGQILPNFLGGKTYLFGGFEGRRFPNYATITKPVPTASLRAGVVAAQQSTGAWQYYNLNAHSVTVPERMVDPTTHVASYVNTTVAPSQCNGPGGVGTCDPLGLGLNPVTSLIWNKQMPAGNQPVQTPGGDNGYNTANFQGPFNESLRSNFMVGRLDHDFGSKNHFTTTYHFFSFNPLVARQVDIGGGIPGDTLGVAGSGATTPALPSMYTASLTTTLSSDATNTFTYSYLRNFWQWSGIYLAPQQTGSLGALGGVMELSGETSNGLIPYNVNTQSTRTRFWDGIGQTFRDDMTLVRGNHMFSFGGEYVHQHDLHQRNDNGGNIDIQTAYLTNQSQVSNGYLPVGYTGKASAFKTYYNAVLGIVDSSQVMYSRGGTDLHLLAQGTPLQEDSVIPIYNGYFSDAWHIRPSLTLTYGAGYTVEMPPYESQGRQVEAVDGNGQVLSATPFFNASRSAALGGQVYNPNIGFATVRNIGTGLKYPYNPFYGGLSPRVSMAWNPNIAGWLFGGSKTVIRGGWSRIYGRLNGVDQVLVPLLGTGLAQPVQCLGPQNDGVTCGGTGVTTPVNAFRIGPTTNCANGNCDNGMTVQLGVPPINKLPQPFYPGQIQNGVVNTAAGFNDSLDPSFKPDRSDEFDLTIQRQFSPTFSTEVGYTGRVMVNEPTVQNLNAVPYMLTLGGQQFQQAFSNMALQMLHNQPVTDQPWFDAALGGAASTYCAGNCAAAVSANYGPSGADYLDPAYGFDVGSTWASLQANPAWQLGRTTMTAPVTCSTPGVGGCPANGKVSSGQVASLFLNTSNGWGNYNGLFWTVQMRNFHHLTAISNFTYSREFGTGAIGQAFGTYTLNDSYNMRASYGPEFIDTPLNYNLYFIYSPGGTTQHGLMGHLLNGWSFAPILTWNNGTFGGYNSVSGTQGNSFGEGCCALNESAILTTGYTGTTGVTRNVTQPGQVGSNGNPGNGGTGLNQFGLNAGTVFSEYRPVILGYDTNGFTGGVVPSEKQWNVDFSLTKDMAVSERFSTELNAQATNVFNHFAPNNPGLSLGDPANFGVIGGNNLASRAVEIGLALRW
ncbi:MAG TPA: carboxypeptidase-like regulatory domain-containing protein [Terriglobales bacterium]|nr:carboxypeptidase-like regulatory domain-containing protein [Terriglobales bacterium]